MKLLSFHPKAMLIDCLAIVAAYAVLFQIMLHTRMIEKVMALNFSWWELILIVLFLVDRLSTYLLVPSVLVAVAVRAIAIKLLQR